MNEVFWLFPGHLGGRCGPNYADWTPIELYEGGVRAILSLNDGEDVDAAELRKEGIDYCCMPMSNHAPPQENDLDYCLRALPAAYFFVESQIQMERPVIVHCRSGKDRTGLFLSYYLCAKLGMTPHQAISRVKEVRPIALSAKGWDVFAVEVLKAAMNR